jgi:hypothetical protein
MKADHPVDLLPIFVTMVVGEFIDYIHENDERNCQGDGKSKCIDPGI